MTRRECYVLNVVQDLCIVPLVVSEGVWQSGIIGPAVPIADSEVQALSSCYLQTEGVLTIALSKQLAALTRPKAQTHMQAWFECQWPCYPHEPCTVKERLSQLITAKHWQKTANQTALCKNKYISLLVFCATPG